jgi:hypothetical protein
MSWKWSTETAERERQVFDVPATAARQLQAFDFIREDQRQAVPAHKPCSVSAAAMPGIQDCNCWNVGRVANAPMKEGKKSLHEYLR